MVRFGALMLAYFFLGLAIIGVFLPGIPTVPFLLLAAWFAARGSEKLHRWLYAHPHLGKLLIDWEQQKAISRTSKIIAVVMLMISWTFMYFNLNNLLGMIGMTCLFITVATFLVSRPEPE
jgi:uncharacterized membrane protein YbaN (DUF454 family)